jgi:hypothetical protein
MTRETFDTLESSVVRFGLDVCGDAEIAIWALQRFVDGSRTLARRRKADNSINEREAALRACGSAPLVVS